MEFKDLSVKIRLLEPQLGTVPKNKEVYKSYIANRAAEANGVEEVETVPEMEEKGWTGFHEDERGIFIYDYMIRGFLKNAGNILKDQLKVKQLKSKIDNFVFVSPRRIYFERDGRKILKPEEVIERPLRAMTAQGPRVTLVRSDCVKADAELSFSIRIIEGPISEKAIRSMLEYGMLCGLGQFRNGSYGRFEVLK